MCGSIGTLEPSVTVPVGVTRVRSCTDNPGHQGPCTCQMCTLLWCNQGICSGCMFLNEEVDGVRPSICAQCGNSTVCTSAKEYLENPWRGMTSDPTEVASSTKGSGKRGKKGSKREASSSDAETVPAPAPIAGLLKGVAVADGNAALKRLGCASIVFARKNEDGQVVTKDHIPKAYAQYIQSLQKALRGDFAGLDATSLLFVVPAPDAYGMPYMWSYPGFAKGLYPGTKELDCFALYGR